MYNKVILIGRLCADPELKQTQSGTYYCKIRLAVNRPRRKDTEQQTDFITVVCWGKTAEFTAQYFTKGKLMIVDGALHNNDYTDANGVKHYTMEVQAQNVAFGETKSANNPPDMPANHPQNAPQVPHFDTLPRDDDLFPGGNPFSDLIL